MKLNDNEQKVLDTLLGIASSDQNYMDFAGLMEQTGLARQVVRRACRSLARKGLTKYGTGLWSDEGQPAGSGYCATLVRSQPKQEGASDDDSSD